MKQDEKLRRGDYLALLFLGLLMGTVFVFFMNIWNGPVTREEVVSITAVLTERLEKRDGEVVEEFILRFSDHEQLHIDGCCITPELKEAVRAIAPGTRIRALVHPKSSTILELTVGEETLLDFDRAMEELTAEKIAFRCLGLFAYAMAAWGAVGLILERIRE